MVGDLTYNHQPFSFRMKRIFQRLFFALLKTQFVIMPPGEKAAPPGFSHSTKQTFQPKVFTIEDFSNCRFVIMKFRH